MTRVLLVGADDAVDEGLVSAGASVTRVPDAIEAIERLSGRPYDCIAVADPAPLPDVARLERRVREAGHAPPVVAVDDSPERIEQVLDAAATHRFDAAHDRRRALRTLVAELRATLDEEVEDAVAETVVTRLVDSGLYRAAWLGRWDTDRGVVPVAASGLEVGTLRSVSPGPEAPVAGRVAVDWSPVTAGTDADATAAVPLVAAEPEGVLQVHADLAGGVGEAEVSLLAELGESVAAALAGSGDDESAVATGPSDDLQVLGDTLAHELGNQLDAARVQLELARERDDDDHFERVESALSRMEGLASDARALARGEVELESLQLSAVADRAWGNVDTADATLSVTEGTVEADPDLLGLLLENCFRNAVQHGGPEVTVSVGPLSDGGLYIADDGPGIPKEEREDVFEWGYSTQSTSGSGLAIVALVAARHGWSVEVTESEAGGARFEVR